MSARVLVVDDILPNVELLEARFTANMSTSSRRRTASRPLRSRARAAAT